MRHDAAVGPVPEDVLHRLAARGGFDEETLVRREGMDTWLAYKHVAPKVLSGTEQLETVRVRVETERCDGCGRKQAQTRLQVIDGQLICPDCRPTYLRHARVAGDVAYKTKPTAGPRRVVAYILDFVLLSLPIFFFVAFFVDNYMENLDGRSVEDVSLFGYYYPILPHIGLAFIVLQIMYDTLFVGRFGATPGKLLMGLEIVRADGRPVGYTLAFGRSLTLVVFGFIISHFPFYMPDILFVIYYGIAFFEKQRRAGHDFVCGTRVIRTR